MSITRKPRTVLLIMVAFKYDYEQCPGRRWPLPGPPGIRPKPACIPSARSPTSCRRTSLITEMAGTIFGNYCNLQEMIGKLQGLCQMRQPTRYLECPEVPPPGPGGTAARA
jgi:hypothetical protein